MTKIMAKSVCFLVVVMLLGAFALAFLAQSGVAIAKAWQSVGSLARASEPTSDVFTEDLIGYLEQGGFQVSQGYPKLYTTQRYLGKVNDTEAIRWIETLYE